MAKKTARAISASKQKPAKETEETLSIDAVSDSSSSEDLSSDEEIDLDGLAQPEQVTQNQSGHVVNVLKKDSKVSTKTQKHGGVIYVGRLPKQLEERELKKYFNQFGDVTKVRVSRNKKTGASRHYAFVQFKQADAAVVAAETMNNYLVFGHLLKVHVVENPKENLFSAKMKSGFKEFDWRAKEYAESHKPKSLETWKKLQQEFEKQKEEKFSELKAQGFDYALEA